MNTYLATMNNMFDSDARQRVYIEVNCQEQAIALVEQTYLDTNYYLSCLELITKRVTH